MFFGQKSICEVVMKYILSSVSVIAIILILIFCGTTTASAESEYFRIHIRANSNSAVDQNVKYLVKDEVVEYLIPLLSEAETKDEAERIINENLKNIESVADAVLSANGFSYKSKAYISFEEFPTREYDDLVLEEGFYDALILALGTGEGDNWWCVVYPPFCFLETKNSENYVYISKIWEIINNIIN